MARPPPPAPPVAPTLTEEQQRAALDASHAAAVAYLERVVDQSIAGKHPDATGLLRIFLPLGQLAVGKRNEHTLQVLSDLTARYVAAGWAHAVVSTQRMVVQGGALVQEIIPGTDASAGKHYPDMLHPALYLVRASVAV